MSTPEKYPASVGRVVSAYVEAVVARTLSVERRTAYDTGAHQRAAIAFDGMLERMANQLPVVQFNHALEWLDGSEDVGCREDGAIIKITDAKGSAICSLSARWLKDLIGYDDFPAPNEAPAASVPPHETPE